MGMSNYVIGGMEDGTMCWHCLGSFDDKGNGEPRCHPECSEWDDTQGDE